MMFRKLLIASVILAATTSSVVFAGSRTVYKGERPIIYKGQLPAQPPCFLAGPYLGASIGNRVNYTGRPAVYNGIEGIASAGLGYMIDPDFYIAGEIWVGDSAKIKDYAAPGGGRSVRSTWNYGLSIIPGFMLADNLLAYVRGGVQRANFRSNPPDACNCNPGTIRNGWHIGIGAQANLTSCLNIRAEYVYGQFSSISLIGTPRSHQINVGLMYVFPWT